MLKFVAGDVLQATQEYIAQGVAEGNQEGLGTGLALKISKRWPDVQAAFKRYVRSRKFRGGDLFVAAPTNDRPGVIYLATQPDMYHATVSYTRKSFRKLAAWAEREGVSSVGLPKIGAGLGKLSWEGQVKPLLKEYFSNSSTEFVVYEEFRSEMEKE